MSEKETREEQLKRIKRRTYMLTLKALFIFSVPAVIAAFIGRAIDNHFDSRPWGSLAILAFFFVMSWVGIFIMDKKFGILTGYKNMPDQSEAALEEKQKSATKSKE
ncbi:MAG: hypothetical protein QY330_01025 [Candidatus Dojkabacteria bacterium]|uniref:F0F1-ATPase n=2 Tax=Candidatus Dojkabacteria TaxID=74243 RepID=A0A136KLT2_9BACT|nr:MAG: hypothetical protein UZ20_WS6002000011 [candidate division WS6 bacterium OLB21]MBW7953494.1 hypothetical protein [Candidatus Dojkabacteria bacterium]WKZ28175.1 MAG: hypothetical protein QY330_01025 [Candidatus Dojkabacteria bacterium]